MPTTATGYRVTRHHDGKITVHGLPIFAECCREPRFAGDFGNFDAEFIRRVVAKAKQRHGEGYFGPCHIRHHEDTPVGDPARPAGTFRILGAQMIRYEGKARLAVLADVTITDPGALWEVMEGRLPFRSVEILHPGSDAPEIDSLALLDHEVPFLRLPNLTIGEVDDRTESVDVPGETFSEPWRLETLDGGGPMVACFSQGTRTALLFKEAPMAAKKTTGKKKAAAKAKTFGAGVVEESATPEVFEDDHDDEDAEKQQEDGALDIAGILKAIQSREISVKDMNAIEAAIRQAQADQIEDEGPEEATPKVAPATLPGMEAMKDNPLVAEVAALKAGRVADAARIAKLEAATKRDQEVAAAVVRLQGRGLENLEDTLLEFHVEHPAGFQHFVDTLAKQNGPLPEKDDDSAGIAKGASPVAMKFADQGADAVKMAMGFENQWTWLSQHTRQSASLEEYVAINMEKAKSA